MKTAKCLRCDECIEVMEDQMVRIEYPEADGRFHRNCFLRSMVGSLGHQLGLCSCGGGPGAMDDPPGLTPRQAASAAAEWFRTKGLGAPEAERPVAPWGMNGMTALRTEVTRHLLTGHVVDFFTREAQAEALRQYRLVAHDDDLGGQFLRTSLLTSLTPEGGFRGFNTPDALEALCRIFEATTDLVDWAYVGRAILLPPLPGGQLKPR